MTPNPWERLREAAQRARRVLDFVYLPDEERDLPGELSKALAALPATPPQQPVPDEERERAIEAWRERSEHMMTAQEGARWVLDGVALMRSAPAPQPEVVEMHSCEIPRLILNPGVLYRFTPAEGCQACADYHKPPRKPVPAPPASDWRERFAVREASLSDSNQVLWWMIQDLRDGLIAAEDRIAALEAEVENLRSQVLP